MVSQNTPSSSSGILHQFIVSDSNSNQAQLNQRLDAYMSSMRCSNTSTFHQSAPNLRSIQFLEERMSRSIDLVYAPNSMPEGSEISHTRHLMDLLGQESGSSQAQQRLSLSLGSQMLPSQNQFRNQSYNNQDLVNPHYSISSEEGRESQSFSPGAGAGANADHQTFPTSPLVSSIRSSRYLKAAQSLLQEVVNISEHETNCDNYCRKLLSRGGRAAVRLSSELSIELSNGFLSDEKQELHMKFVKLVSLLEEVESRFERYYNQMQEVVSLFEGIAGAGSARCYTGLALQAMSKHFSNLSDAILNQIKIIKRKLQQDSPRMSSLFEQEGKHNRMTLQQIGLLHCQRQAWRPIRGLPETSVVILRAWLFEHFLHPYPTESEKLILSSQTGLSKNQVSNWFINARVRLWKPMIEEMYKEECADSSDSDPLGASRMTGEARMVLYDE